MRLLRPSPGEAVDRQTILHLKCKYGELKHINVKPFTDEINELQTYLDVHFYHKISEENGQRLNVLYADLAALNGKLWKLEDEARIRRVEQPRPVERLADMRDLTTDLNDARAMLVQQVNALFTISEPEKVYIAQ